MSERLSHRSIVLCAAMVALTMGAANAAEEYCLFCDYSDGSCCETQAIIGGGCLAACAGDYAGTGECVGNQGPCRLPRGNCVFGWDKTCCEAKGGYVDWSCPAAAPEANEDLGEPLDADCAQHAGEGVTEVDGSNAAPEVNACPADGVGKEVSPSQEDAFCFCPGGRCCGGTCYPGARCCQNGIGYECCSSADCFGGGPCLAHHCILDPD